MTFGYDNFNDKRQANNHQSGSDYRILGTSTILQGTNIFPQFLGNGTTIIQWNPILVDSAGSNFRTHSFFYNDAWRVTRPADGQSRPALRQEQRAGSGRRAP